MQENEKKTHALVPAKGGAVVQSGDSAPDYWERSARRFTLAYRVLLVVLVLFIVVFMVVCSNAFTYESIFYFGKDLHTLAALVGLAEDTVYYTYAEGAAPPVPYRGGAAVVQENRVTVYGAGGNLLLDFAVDYEAPRGVSSRNYLLSYDFGGRDFAVSNSYAKLYSGTADHAIYGAFVSDAGYFTLITASDSTLSAVQLYDPNFNLIATYPYSGAVIATAISENGRYLTVAVARSTGAAVEVFAVGAANASTVLSFEGEMPLALGFTSNASLALLTDTACHTFGVNGKQHSSFDFGGAALSAFAFDEGGVAFTLEADRMSGEHRVLALDKRGDVEADLTLAARVLSLARSEESLFVLTAGEVSRVSLADGERIATAPVGEDAMLLAVLGDKSVRVFYPARAVKVTLTE